MGLSPSSCGYTARRKDAVPAASFHRSFLFPRKVMKESLQTLEEARKTLGLSRRMNLSLVQVNKAFRNRSLFSHPDKDRNNPHANANFQKVKDAAEVLRKEENRKPLVAPPRRPQDQFRKMRAKSHAGAQTLLAVCATSQMAKDNLPRGFELRDGAAFEHITTTVELKTLAHTTKDFLSRFEGENPPELIYNPLVWNITELCPFDINLLFSAAANLLAPWGVVVLLGLNEDDVGLIRGRWEGTTRTEDGAALFLYSSGSLVPDGELYRVLTNTTLDPEPEEVVKDLEKGETFAVLRMDYLAERLLARKCADGAHGKKRVNM